MLIAHHIYKSFGTRRLIQNLNLQVEAGQMVAIMGPSGSGKTTLLQLLSTLLPIDQGKVTLNGINLEHIKGKALAAFRNQNIGFVFQMHHLLPEFTLFENVCLPGYLSNAPTKTVKKNAQKWLNELDLMHCQNQFPQDCSGGELQRTAIARACINDPSILFADEPTGSLDQKNSKKLHALFVHLSETFQKTLLWVTHDPLLTQKAHQILHIEDGRLQPACT